MIPLFERSAFYVRASRASTYVLHVLLRMCFTCTVGVTNLNVNTSNSEQGIRHITLLIIAYCYNINLEPTDMLLRVQCLQERGLPRYLKRKTAGA